MKVTEWIKREDIDLDQIEDYYRIAIKQYANGRDNYFVRTGAWLKGMFDSTILGIVVLRP